VRLNEAADRLQEPVRVARRAFDGGVAGARADGLAPDQLRNVDRIHGSSVPAFVYQRKSPKLQFDKLSE
jgi:hypothetical protein